MKNKIFPIGFLILLLLGALGVGIFFEDPFSHSSADFILQAPSVNFWLGTDSLGRDLLLQILFGARVTILISCLSAAGTLAIAFVTGTAFSFLTGYFESFTLRFFDVIESIPHILLSASLAFMLQTILGKNHALGSYENVLIIILTLILSQWFHSARLLRSRFKLVLKEEYVKASYALGAGKFWITTRHLWPASKDLLWTLFLLQLPQAIFLESFLSFVGLGIETPLTSWGVLIHEGWKTLSYAPHLILAPTIILFLTMYSLTCLRDT